MSDGLFLTGKQIKTFDMVLPRHMEGPFLAPFRTGGLTIEGSFDVEAYPGAIERFQEMARSHPDYCGTCEGFPCKGGHPGLAETVVNAFVDPLIMVVNDILDAGVAAAEAVGKALAAPEG